MFCSELPSPTNQQSGPAQKASTGKGQTDNAPLECTALIIFGVTGDLAKKKIFSALYDLARINRLDIPIIGVGRSDWDTEKLRQIANEAVQAAGEMDIDQAALACVLDRLTYVRGSYDDEALYARLADLCGKHQNVLCYLAVPPIVFENVIGHLANTSMSSGIRLLIEKPFGNDVASALSLSAFVTARFPEEQVFAVDHYLQKEALQNVMILRFANRVLDPCWNSNHIDKVDILLSESIGIEGRVGFFDEVGTLRDVVQNHALQVVAALAMEAPLTSSADHINDRRAELLAEVVPFTENETIFGQYTGYRDVEGVPKTSQTDTFIYVTFTIDNDRWRGTTWSITAGKALHRTATEVTVQFREAVSPAFIDEHCLPERNSLHINLAPVEAVELRLQARSSTIAMGTAATTMTTNENYRPYEELQAYARLFDAARRNDHSQFARPDVIHQAWRIVHPVLQLDHQPVQYRVGSTGPDIAKTSEQMSGSFGAVIGSMQ